ncbi:MAG: adenylate/guanylate cyclase domain-containing response regulator, partial [Luminiphilus sp.]
MSDLDDTSQEWAARIVEAAGPLKDAMGRRTVSVSSDERRDLDALLDALARLTDLADQSGREVKHDRLNIIGAVRGYSEMLAEEASKLHPSIANTLPPLLGAVESPVSVIGKTSAAKAGKQKLAQDPGVILAVDDLPENRDLVSRLLSKAGHTVITA